MIAENADKKLEYVLGTTKVRDKTYHSTTLCLEKDCYKFLEFSASSSYESSLIAATIARKTNWIMNGKANDLERETLPQTPTYPIKNGDLIWIASIQPIKKIYGPFQVEINGIAIRTISRGSDNGKIRDIIKANHSYYQFRLYKHVDMSDEVVAINDITQTFTKEDENPFNSIEI